MIGDQTNPEEQRLRTQLLEDDSDDNREDEMQGPGCTGRTNNGNKVIGPWVLGMYSTSTEKRFIVILDRSACILHPIIRENIGSGSTIWTDEWAGYRRLSEHGFQHQTVNHSLHFVDPVTGAHTQGIERAWEDEKIWLKRIRRPTEYLLNYLDESVWRSKHKSHPRSLMIAFLEDVKRFYSTETQ